MPRQGTEAGHRREAAEQMDRNHRACRIGHGRRGGVEVERGRLWVDVGEDRRGADKRDRAGRGDERERGRHHLVTRADPERAQGEHQGGGSAAHGDRVIDADQPGDAALELLDTRLEDELVAVGDLADDIDDDVAPRGVAPPEVVKRHRQGRHRSGGHPATPKNRRISAHTW
jgi:hypothetical protein